MTEGTAWKVAKGIPEGAQLRGFTIDPNSNVLYLFVEHESFTPVDPYSVAPLLDTEFHKIIG